MMMMTMKLILLIIKCCIDQHFFDLPMLIYNYHRAKKENLTFLLISIQFSVACGTFSTGY